MNLNFRKAELDDIEKINDLVNSAYRGESSKQGWTTEATILDGQRSDIQEIKDIILDNNQVIILCLNEQTIIGTVVIQNKSDCAYLGMLTVKPNLQGAEIGKKLLKAAENYVIKEWRLKLIEMTVIRQRTELIDWYNRRGYLSTDETRPFPYDDPSFGLPKIMDLEFVVLKKEL